jgi:tagatose-6-phosphate ketose/aldose isomerase
VAGRIVEISARPRAEAATDTVAVPLLPQAEDVDLLWPYVAVAQMFAFHVSRALGLSPDNPNKLGTVNRVVQGVRLHAVP